MAVANDPFAPRPMDEVKKELHDRAKHNRNPFLYTIYDEVAPVIDRLESVDRDGWADVFGALVNVIVKAVHLRVYAAGELVGDSQKSGVVKTVEAKQHPQRNALQKQESKQRKIAAKKSEDVAH